MFTDPLDQILPLLKKSFDPNDLIRKMEETYTPRLWGKSLIQRESFEGRCITFIRQWEFFNNERKQWKQVIRKLFAELKTTEIEKLNDKEKNILFSLKFSYAKKSQVAKQPLDNLKKVLETCSQTETSEATTLHWTKDPVVLQALSLLRNSNSPSLTHLDDSFFNAIFSVGNQTSLYLDPSLLQQWISLTNEYLHTLDPKTFHAIHALFQQANVTETTLQETIALGSIPSHRAIAEQELVNLSDDVIASLENLPPGAQHLIFGGVPAQVPSLKMNAFAERLINPLLIKFIENGDTSYLVDKLMEFLPQDSLSTALPEEFHERFQGILKTGFIAALFPELKESFLNDQQGLAEKALWMVPEVLRKGAETSLTFVEQQLVQDLAEKFAKATSKEFCSELREAVGNQDLEETLKVKLRELLHKKLSIIRKVLLSELTNLSTLLPQPALQLFSVAGLGTLGSPESPLWFEFIKESDQTYTLLVYASGASAELQGVVPLKFSHLSLEQLDNDFFLRLFTYRAWPEWDAKNQYTVKDVHTQLLASLQRTPELPEQHLQELVQDISSIQGPWGLFKGFISSHLAFKERSERDVFFFNWKKQVLIHFWMQNGKEANTQQQQAIIKAANTLADESIELFKANLISEEELKAIYATTWEILETLQPKQQPKPLSPIRPQIVPPEMLAPAAQLLNALGLAPQTLKALLVDILGEESREGLNLILKDLENAQLYSAPQEPPPPLSKSFAGRKIVNHLLESTLGVNLSDFTNPTFFSYVKITLSVTRIALSILFPSLSLGINLPWVIGYLTKGIFFTIGEKFLPEQMRQLRDCQQRFNAWKLRMIARATANLLLDDTQKDALNQLIGDLKAILVHSGTLSFDLVQPPILPSKTLSLKKIIPLANSANRTQHALPFQDALSSLLPQLSQIDSHNTLSLLQKCLEEAINLPHEHTQAFFCNEVIKALPVPSTSSKDFWDELADDDEIMHILSQLSKKLSLAVITRSSQHLKNEAAINLYKVYAIIDKLARRCPEAMLDSYTVNPWALALIKKHAAFYLHDPKMQNQFIQICAYFGIDYDKDYTDGEINQATSNALFFEADNGDEWGYIYDTHVFKSPTRRYYEAILETPQAIEKLEALGYKDLSHSEKLAMLMAENEQTDPQHHLLSSAFRLLRQANWLANTVMASIPTDLVCLDNQTNSELSYEKKNITENVLSSVSSFANTFIPSSIFSYIPSNPLSKERKKSIVHWLPGNYTQITKRGVTNAAERKELISDTPSWDRNHNHLLKKSRPLITTEDDEFHDVIRKHFHTPSRQENEILNQPSQFYYVTKQFMFSEKTSIFLSELPLKERAVIEMLWSDEEDQAVSTLDYFTEQLHRMSENLNYLELFKILILRGNVLQKQLKTNPAFCKVLGEFFQVALTYFTHQKNIYGILALIEIGTFTLIRAREVNPNAKDFFPDFNPYLKKVETSPPNISKGYQTQQLLRDYSLQLHTLSFLIYRFLDPQDASVEEKQSACITLWEKIASFNPSNCQELFSETLERWMPTIILLVDSDLSTRNQVLNTFAWQNKLVQKDLTLHWEGNFPTYVSGPYTITLPKNLSEILDRKEKSSLCSRQDQHIINFIQKQLSTLFGREDLRLTSHENVYSVEGQPITITLGKMNPDQSTPLLFRMQHQKRTYCWVDSSHHTQTPSETYWLEENDASTVIQLLTFKDGKVTDIQLVEKNHSNSEFTLLEKGVPPPDNIGEQVDLMQEWHQLKLLTWFQPLSAIKVFRAFHAPHRMKRIEFSNLDLTFDIQDIQGQVQAVGKGKIANFWIAKNQKQDQKFPVLNQYARYLLLENAQDQKRVILPSDTLTTSIGAYLLRQIGMSNSNLMDLHLNQLLNTLISPSKNENTPSYYVYSIDSQGRLTSKEPDALLHLLLYSLAQGQLDDVAYYLESIEGIGKRSRFPTEAFELIREFTISTLFIPDPLLTRIVLRLGAISEENRVTQPSTDSHSVPLGKALLSWIALQINYKRYSETQSLYPHLPFDELQELFLLNAILNNGSMLLIPVITENFDSNSELIQYCTSILKEEAIAKTFLMLPEISQRHQFLKLKYPIDEPESFNFVEFACAAVENQLFNTLNPSSRTTTDVKEASTTSAGIRTGILQHVLSLATTRFSTSLSTLLSKYGWHSFTLEQVSEKFISKYRLAFGEPTQDVKNNPAELEIFRQKSAHYQTKLQEKSRNKTLKSIQEIVLLVTDPKYKQFFPTPDALENLHQTYRNLIQEATFDSVGEYNNFVKRKHLIALFEKGITHAYLNILSIELNTQWKKIPIHFTEMNSQLLKNAFLSYYQLVTAKPPRSCLPDSEEMQDFLTRSKAFKKTLLFAQGKNEEETQLLNILKFASAPSAFSSFPDVSVLEENIAHYLEHLQNASQNLLTRVQSQATVKNALRHLFSFGEEQIDRDFFTVLVTDPAELNEPPVSSHFNSEVNCLGNVLHPYLIHYGLISPSMSDRLNIIQSFIPDLETAQQKALGLPLFNEFLTAFAKNQASSMLFNTGISYLPSYLLGFSIPTPMIIAAQVGFKAYQGYCIYDHMHTEKEKAKQAILASEKDAEEEQVLPEECLSTFKSHDHAFETTYRAVLFENFKPVNQTSSKETPLEPFVSPSTHPYVIKKFAQLNANLNEYYARPETEKFPEEFQGIEHYHQIGVQLKQLQTALQEALQKAKTQLFQQTLHPQEERSDLEMIQSERTIRHHQNARHHAKQTLDMEFKNLLMAFIAHDEERMLSCTARDRKDLPLIQSALYHYLLQATRLQQLDRCLKIHQQINPLDRDIKTQMLIKQFAFELGRKRAYPFDSTLPTKLMRGFLAFEYLNDMMLWERQIPQVLRMMDKFYASIMLQLSTGSGKTAFVSPMIGFMGSDGKHVVDNCFPESLAPVNIENIAQYSKNFFNQEANTMLFSRETKLTVDNLKGMRLKWLRAQHKKEHFNGTKTERQALELRLIEDGDKLARKIETGTESRIWHHMQLLATLHKVGVANIEEGHHLLKPNDELNHPIGAKKKLKKSYINVIVECIRLLAAIPEIKQAIPLHGDNQPLCSLKTYHAKIKPILAQQMAAFSPFRVAEEQRQEFISYLCGQSASVPDFVLNHKRKNDIGMARGVLNKILPHALERQINVDFGTKGNPHGYAQPYSGKDAPIEGSTLKNPHEAAVKTLICALHEPLSEQQVYRLIANMVSSAKSEQKSRGIPFEKTRSARLIEAWTRQKFTLNETTSSDISQWIKGSNFTLTEFTRLLNKGYGARISYARLFAISEIEYFAENLSSDSYNYPSMYSRYVSTTASPNNEELLPIGTEVLLDKGTTGEFVANICRTCTEENIVNIQDLSPKEIVRKILEVQFAKGSTMTALMDNEPLFLGLSNEEVVSIIHEFIQEERHDIWAVVFFNGRNELVIQEPGKEAVPLANSSIPEERRMTYYDHIHTFGADVKQPIGSSGTITIGPKSTLSKMQQSGGRMRLYPKHQDLAITVNETASQLINPKKKPTIRDIVTHNLVNEALENSPKTIPTVQKQMANVIRSEIMHLLRTAPDVPTFIRFLREFRSTLFSKTEEDAFELYGHIEVKLPPKDFLNTLRTQCFKVIQSSTAFSSEKKKEIWAQLENIGTGVTFAEDIMVYKRNGEAYIPVNEFGTSQRVRLSQHVSQNVSQNQQATKEQEAHQNQEIEQEQDQNVDIQAPDSVNLSSSQLRLHPAEWDASINYFDSLNWWKVSTEGASSHQTAEIYRVEQSLYASEDELLGDIAKGFQGHMYWSNNLRGILRNDTLSKPYSGSHKPIQKILMIQEGDGPILTCAIDKNEVRFWRKQLETDRNKSEKKPSENHPKIALFSLTSNAIIAEGQNTFGQTTLATHMQFNFDVARWKFLAGHVNLQKNAESIQKNQTESLYSQFQKWIIANDFSKMAEAQRLIHQTLKLGQMKNSDMERLFSTNSTEAIQNVY